MRAAWPAVDPLLRLCWAQMWAEPFRATLASYGFDPDQVVDAFTAENPTHPLWPQFEDASLKLTDFGPNVHTWSVTSGLRIIAPDVELVGLAPIAGIKPGDSAFVIPFVMRFSESRWRVLNFFGERIPEPGWPPTLR